MITQEELLAEYNRLTAINQSEGLTATEIAKMLGCGVDKARNIIRKGIADGSVKLTSKQTTTISGMAWCSPAYIFTSNKQPKGHKK